ncbi:MAG: hypothetical protein OXI05_07910 [Bacteroidota bacterium]|nr:hypothetical protein [Bacteroidota bacterium]MXW14475.1 hypothetical protein [Rhodothermaceae bacterium]MDE2645746.1 hypothetical protein [Bacteroidota bacterium]MXZ16892.1 hypothetical protein [Rhodothermaceae bacterium]MYC05268.1 hypothetical protein [Rhodothermaceae bacterium]
MEVSTLDLYVAAGTSVFLIIGSLVSIISLFSRRLARYIEQTNTRIDRTEARLIASIDGVKTDLTDRINRVEDRLAATIGKVDSEQKAMNAQIADFSRKVYALNGQVQGLVVQVRGREGILMQGEVQPPPTPPLFAQ